MQKILLGILTLVFLVILSPVFMFSMLAPRAFSTILAYWSIFVGIAAMVLGGLCAYIRADLRD
ncbi:hypothetical protein DESUT3_02950 [Desulfuromonas versatilis]|uniref:Uncharacterized protein n=1 Tax=Desulfuromonas versatilis TaxID=2802975 RepID=A0ABM8HS07_9BACT|nr:hypothetical protein [Desulfuromonas versatilis]BCR03226.1 hypothetical protein DESUT3_02950 [Desulfuromonas versatilis]